MPRDEKGRFVKPHPEGRTPPKGREPTEAEKVEQVLEMLHRKAVEGDIKASELYLRYTAGKSSTTDLQTWRQEVERILNEDDSQTGDA